MISITISYNPGSLHNLLSLRKWTSRVFQQELSEYHKKIVGGNKKTWNKKLVNALWADRLTTKKSIGTSPYQLVYGMEVVFPSSLGTPVMKLLQEVQVEPNDIQRRINQTIHLQQTREEVYIRSQVMHERIKKAFDKRTKTEDFYLGDKVFKWDSRR